VFRLLSTLLFYKLRDFENRVLRKVFVCKREEVTGGWRKLHNEQLHELCWSSNIIRVFRLRRIGSVWHVACVGEGETCMQGSGGERDHIQGGRIILKWSL